MRVKYYLGGQEVEPQNREELSIDITFDRDSPVSSLQVNNFRFVNTEAEIINNLIANNKIFQAIPFDIVISNLNTSRTLNTVLDLSSSESVFSCNDVTVSAKEKAGIEWLTDIADSFTFEYLYEETVHLNKSKFIDVPYIINTVPNYREVIVAIIGTVFVATQLYEASEVIKGKIAGAANPFSSITAALELALYILYVITLLITLVKLIKDIILLIIQPVKYHKGMYARDLVDSACAYLGLTFQSSILKQGDYKDLLILPRKYENPNDPTDKRLLGFLSPSNSQTGYFEGTFGDLLRALKLMFNAKIWIDSNNVLRFEHVDFSNGTSTYVIPDIRQDFVRYNTDEINANYLVEFQTDVNDKNTIQEYTGTIYQVTTDQNIADRKLSNLKGYTNASIPFALGKRKEKLTIPEEIVDAFLDGISTLLNVLITVSNAVIKLVNTLGKTINLIKKVLNFFGIKTNLKAPDIKSIEKVDFGEIIDNRIGMLMLENDAVLVPKVLLVDSNGKLKANHKDILSAKQMYERFHYSQSFVPNASNPNANQYKKYKIEKAPFCFDDFLLVVGNSKIKSPQNEDARIYSLKWNIENQTANIEYGVNSLYISTLFERKNEGQGY